MSITVLQGKLGKSLSSFEEMSIPSGNTMLIKTQHHTAWPAQIPN